MKSSSAEKPARGPESLQEDLLRKQTTHLESAHEDLLRRQKRILLEKCRRIAVVGASPDPSSNSYLSIEKLSGLDLEVIPILPGCHSYLGLPCYRSLADVPGDVDVVQVYAGEGMALEALAGEAVEKRAQLFWVEEGQVSREIKEFLADKMVQVVEEESLEREYAKEVRSLSVERTAPAAERRSPQVREFMTKRPVTVKLGDPVKEALDKMERGNFRHLPVVDSEGKLVGMISDRDVRLIHPSPIFVQPEHVPAQLLMIKVRQAAILNPVVISPGASLEEAARLMLRVEVGALPVVGEGGVLVGIITYEDLLREFLAREQRR